MWLRLAGLEESRKAEGVFHQQFLRGHVSSNFVVVHF